MRIERRTGTTAKFSIVPRRPGVKVISREIIGRIGNSAPPPRPSPELILFRSLIGFDACAYVSSYPEAFDTRHNRSCRRSSTSSPRRCCYRRHIARTLPPVPHASVSITRLFHDVWQRPAAPTGHGHRPTHHLHARGKSGVDFWKRPTRTNIDFRRRKTIRRVDVS